jgi:hypothetical protein
MEFRASVPEVGGFGAVERRRRLVFAGRVFATA